MMDQASIFDFSAFPVLTTTRLVLRAFVPADAPDLFAFRSDAIEQKFNDAPLTDVSQVHTLIEWMNIGFAAQQQIQWAITLRAVNRVIGLFGFNSWDRYHRRAEVGYDLARAYWGQRLATEALAAILRFGFEQMQLNRIEAQTIADNTESVRLLGKLGFKLEGVRREYSLEEDGVYHGGAIYGLLKHEYIG
jgi:ribosomal-protein-alanine N-acetyltransferase